MSQIQIAVINNSTVIDNTSVEAAVAVLQKQVSQDFAAIWGIDAALSFIAAGSSPSHQQWWLVILDNSDQAGALGYHDLTNQGLPLGKVFVQTSLQDNENWTVTASHELLEMLADPDINLCALDESSANSGRLYAYEACDAVQSGTASYIIDEIAVSDFVYPAWFEGFWRDVDAAAKPKFDHRGLLTDPFQLHQGGYISVMDVTSSRGWVQIFGSEAQSSFDTRARPGSRRERRRRPRSQWIRSRPLHAVSIEPSQC